MTRTESGVDRSVCSQDIADTDNRRHNKLMEEGLATYGMDAARRMAAMSPETEAYFEAALAPLQDHNESLKIYVGFAAIGNAIGSKRTPVSPANLKKIFEYAEHLLKHGSEHVANAVAVSMLEAIWSASLEGGFEFAMVDPFLGPEARRYLVAWDDFNERTTPGLRRT